MAKGNWKRILAMGLAGLAAAVILYAVWPPQRNLLARSRRVLWLPGDPSGQEGSSRYYWQSSKQIATVSFHAPDFVAESVNIDTNQTIAITSLSHWVWLDNQWNKTLSPDGKWALASVSHAAMITKPNGKWSVEADDDKIAGHSTLVTLSDLQGRHKSTQAVFSGIVSGAFWLSGSRRWAIMLNTHNRWFVEEHDLLQPKAVRLIPIRQTAHRLLDTVIGYPDYTRMALTASEDDQVIIASYQTPEDQGATVGLINLRHNPAGFQQTFLPLPVAATLRSIAASGDGKQIAWILDFAEKQKIYPTPWESFREQYIKYIKGQPPPDPQPYPSEELWVSRRDGSKMRELGHMPQPDARNRLSTLRWTPDGRQISFVYKDYLYVMPATDFWHG